MKENLKPKSTKISSTEIPNQPLHKPNSIYFLQCFLRWLQVQGLQFLLSVEK